MTSLRTFTAAFVLAVTAVCGVGTSAASAAQDAPPPLREVCWESVYLKRSPGAIVAGTLFRGEKVQVRRYSRSRRYVQVVAHRPRFSPRGWLPTASLCANGKTADFAKTARYSLKIANQLAGGDPGFLYVGGPAKITVRDRQRAGQTFTLCITPAPIAQESCRKGRTGVWSGLAWSQAVPTQVRVTIDGGPTLSTTVHPYAIPADR